MDANSSQNPETTPLHQLQAESGGGAKYRLIGELGRGGMSDVFLALMTGAAGFSKLVVIKRLEPLLARDGEFLNMFLDEARLAARLNHPNVVQTHEVGFAHDRYFIAMEYLEGQPLNRILRRVFHSGGMDLTVQIRILCDVLTGLHYAHELRDFDGSPLEVVHRDVSPQNVFVTYDGQVKVVDFGVAKARSSSDGRSGMIKGKVAYMAPEQALCEPIDRRADIYSLGVMLWEIAARRRMWKGSGVPQIVTELIAGRIPRLADMAPETPPALQAICDRATAHQREERFESAAEFRTELELLLERLEPKSGRDVGAQVRALFADERTRVTTLIERQLGHMRLGSDTTPTAPYSELPRFDDSETRLSDLPTPRPEALVGHGHEAHSSDASAYGVQMSSIRPEQLGASSLHRRAIALAAVLGLLALGGTFLLVSALPAASTSTAAPAVAAGSEPREEPVRTSALARALVAPARPAEPVGTREAPAPRTPPRYAAPDVEQREAQEPGETQRRRPVQLRETDNALQRAPGSRRAPRHLDKDDPWAE
jgi:eukaryotic-like serine/threonine-protein kinase